MSEGGCSIVDLVRDAVTQDRVTLPPLPELATRLQEALADDEINARAVAELVRRDPAVAAAILRGANSAAFGGLQPINDVRQAVARLGIKRVASLVTTITLRGHFTSPSPDKRDLFHRLWNHSVLCASSSRRLAQLCGYDTEEAFLGGLLHDIGRALVLKAVDQLQAEDAGLEITDTLLDEVMELLHGELGHRALTDWRIPEPICQVALEHEEPLEDQITLRTLVQAADAVARKLGQHPRPAPELDLLEEPAIELLGIRDIQLAELMVALEDEFEQLKGMIQS